MDFLAPNDSTIVYDFLNRIKHRLKEKAIEDIEVWFPTHHFLVESARSAGFEVFPEPLGIVHVVIPFPFSPQLQWISENLYCNMADADLF